MLKKFRHSVVAQKAKPRGLINWRLRIEYSSVLIPNLILLCISSRFGKTIDGNEFKSSQMTMRPSREFVESAFGDSELKDSMRLKDSLLSFHLGSTPCSDFSRSHCRGQSLIFATMLFISCCPSR